MSKRATAVDGNASLLKWNFGWTLAGNVAYAVAQWGLVLAIARLGTPGMLGVFVLGLAIAGPVILLTNLKLRAILVTDVRGDYEFGHYLALRLLSLAGALTLIALIALFVADSNSAFLVFLLIGVSKAADALSNLLLGYLQRQERMGGVAASRIIQAVAQLTSFVVVLAWTGAILPAVGAWAAASIVVTVAFDLPLVRRVAHRDNAAALIPSTQKAGRRIAPIFELASIRSLAWMALPLGIAVAMTALWVNIPRYFIAAIEGNAALGVFAAIVSLNVVGATIVGAMAVAVSPRLAKHAASHDLASFDKLVGRLVLIGVSFGVAGTMVALAFGEAILNLVYGSEYSEHPELLVIVIAATAVQYSFAFLASGIQAMRNFKVQAPIQIASVAVVAGSAWFLVGPYGITGAGIAMLIAATFELCAYTIAFVAIRRRALLPVST